MSALSIGFAGSCYRFGGLNPAQDALARARFRALVLGDETKPDVEIDVHHVPNPRVFMRRPPGPTEYRVAVSHRDDALSVAGIGFTANVDRSPLRAQMQTCLTDEGFLAAFENLFRVVAAYRLFEEGGLVMHSAAFTDAGRGFLFCGRSGAGKTSLCELANELQLPVLSDELNAVMLAGGSYAIVAMPFAGDFGGTPAPHPPYPLVGLLGLAHGESPSIGSCSKAEAVSRIVASCPYVNADPLLVDELTSRATRLVAAAPLRILTFAKSTTFWSVLDHEYRSPDATISA